MIYKNNTDEAVSAMEKARTGDYGMNITEDFENEQKEDEYGDIDRFSKLQSRN